MHVVLESTPRFIANKDSLADPACDPAWVEMSTVVEEKRVRNLIPSLYEAGARGVIELPLNKIVE